MSTGITFDDRIHTERDWGLKLLSVYIPMPDPKTQLVDIPGGDGNIDLTELNGRPAYSDRSGIELDFDLMDRSYSEWFAKYSKFAAEVHGRKVKMVLDDDPNFYYMTRLNLDGEKENRAFSQVTLTGSAEPFKYDVSATNEPWLWDTFDFENGVVREMDPVTISADNKKVTILGAGIDTAPVFVVSQAQNLQLSYGGRTYTLQVGRNRFPAVRVGKSDVTLTFSGTGTFEVEYRGRYL